MASESRHISQWIDRRADDVYEYGSNPANLQKRRMNVFASPFVQRDEDFRRDADAVAADLTRATRA